MASRRRGWLVNKERRMRRDRVRTLSDQDVMKLINEINEMEKYSKLSKPNDQHLRRRDQALIALSWIFFKRAGETLRIKLGDIYIDEVELAVTFNISKKARGIKVCSSCGEENGRRGRFCRTCGENLSRIPIVEVGQTLIPTKRKSIEYWACIHVARWIEALKGLGCNRESYIFPPFNYIAKAFLLDRHLTVQRFNQILQRLDPTLTTHMFRYGATEKFLRLDYTPYDLKEIGDWSSTHMPEAYAKRMGLTPSQTKFMKDVRTT